MILNHYRELEKGTSLITLLVTMGIFSSLFLFINQWVSHHRKSAVDIYLRYQALQIAENQHQRLFLEPHFNCPPDIKQNGYKFKINCSSKNVQVSYADQQVNLSLD